MNALGISHRLSPDKDFGGLTLLGFDQWPASVRQGENEFVTLYWQARTVPLPDRQVTLQMQDDRQVIVLSRSGPVHGTYPTSQWDKDEFVADRLALHIPPDTPAGPWMLEVQVDDFPVHPLGRFEVQAIARNWTPPTTSTPMSVTLGSQVALVGYDIKSQALAPHVTPGQPQGQSAGVPDLKSQTVELTLHWQALQEMSESYTVFVHVVDRSDAVRAQKDNAPMNSTYPTTLWQPGEFVRDTYTLSLPPDLPPGDYALEVGLYLADTGARLPVVGDGDRVVLTTVTITP